MSLLAERVGNHLIPSAYTTSKQTITQYSGSLLKQKRWNLFFVDLIDIWDVVRGSKLTFTASIVMFKITCLFNSALY